MIEQEVARGTAFFEARGLTKNYGHIRALDNVDFSVKPGEIVALVGDNGAGKSTLIRVLSGATQPDSGEMRLDGQQVHFHGPNDARAYGIETVYQHYALVPNLDVVSNLFLGREVSVKGPLGGIGHLSRRAMRRRSKELLENLEIRLPSIDSLVATLSGGQRQSVAIARSVAFASRLLIMDEPTAALGVAQSEAVLRLMQRVRDQGVSVIVISHIMPHVIRVADRVAVLRHGRLVADLPKAEVSQDRLVRLIVGFERGAAEDTEE